MMRKLSWLFVALSMLGAFSVLGASCGLKSAGTSAERGAKAAERKTEASGAGKPITIGFSIATDTFIIERWNKDMKIFSGAARELGAEVIVQLSAGGIKEQIAQINFLVNRNIDVLVVIAHDTEMIGPAIRQVKSSGIPVVAYDRMVMGIPLDAYISFDNQEVGRLFGKALTEAVPEGKYLVVNGSIHDNNSFMVHDGLMEVLDPYVKSGKIAITHELWLDEWSSDEALLKIGKVFEETVDFDAISCANDQIANAAIQLLSERRLAGKIAVVGQDADLITCQRVVEGTQLMTVYKPIAKLAARAARLAIALAKRTAFPYDTLLDNGSGNKIPSYIEKPTAVFKRNMDATIIQDGFHATEDVYRNILHRVEN